MEVRPNVSNLLGGGSRHEFPSQRRVATRCFRFAVGHQSRGFDRCYRSLRVGRRGAVRDQPVLAACRGPGPVPARSRSPSGAKESIRCRAVYNVDAAGSNLDLRLRCASDSFKFELQSNAAHNNGAVSGSWTELTRHVGGTIAGSASGSRIQVLVQGTIAAHLAVSTRANQQSISIEAPGSDMSNVSNFAQPRKVGLRFRFFRRGSALGPRLVSAITPSPAFQSRTLT